MARELSLLLPRAALALGLLACLAGFGVAVWAVLRFKPRVLSLAAVACGLASALYGFTCAFRSLARGRPVRVGSCRLAFTLTTLGLLAASYALAQAVAGSVAAPVRLQPLCIILTASGAVTALCGFVRAYIAIARSSRARCRAMVGSDRRS